MPNCRSIVLSVSLLFIKGTQENPTNHHQCCQICTRASQYEVPHRKEQGAFRWDVSSLTCTAATREHRAGIFLVQRKNRVKGWDLELGGRCCWNSLSASASSSTPLRTETDMLFSIVGVNLTVFGSCAAVRDSELWVCLIMTGTRIKGLHRRARVAWNGIYFISSMLSHHQSCAYPDPPCVRWAAPSASGDTIGDGIA